MKLIPGHKAKIKHSSDDILSPKKELLHPMVEFFANGLWREFLQEIMVLVTTRSSANATTSKVKPKG